MYFRPPNIHFKPATNFGVLETESDPLCGGAGAAVDGTGPCAAARDSESRVWRQTLTYSYVMGDEVGSSVNRARRASPGHVDKRRKNVFALS